MCHPVGVPIEFEFKLKHTISPDRITIPKWLQRGCMDPLDKICSLLVLRTVQLVQEEKQQQQQQNSSEVEETSRRGLRSRQH